MVETREYDRELIEYLRIIFGDNIEIQREKKSWIKIPQATIHVNEARIYQKQMMDTMIFPKKYSEN